MPIYEFKCVKCGHEDHFILNIKDRNTVQECTECKAEMERKVSIPLLMGFNELGQSK